MQLRKGCGVWVGNSKQPELSNLNDIYHGQKYATDLSAMVETLFLLPRTVATNHTWLLNT